MRRMYKILLLLACIAGGSISAAFAQEKFILWSQDFNDTTATNQVASLDAFGEIPQPIVGTNVWTINNKFNGQGLYVNTPDEVLPDGEIVEGPQSPYLHVVDQTSAAQNANWNPVTESNHFCVLASAICTKGLKDIELTFYWIGDGASSAYAEFYYTYQGNPWTLAQSVGGKTQYNANGQQWHFETIKLDECADRTDISIGVRWTNKALAPDINTVSFGMDDIFLTAKPEDVNITVTIPPGQVPCRGGSVVVCFQQSKELCPGIYIFEMAEKPLFGEPVFGLGSVAYILDENFQQAMAAPGEACINLPVPASLSVGACFVWRVRRVGIWGDASEPHFPGLPGSPGLEAYLYPPTFTSPGSDGASCFEIKDCREEIWTLGYTPSPFTAISKEAECDVVCVNSIASVSFNSKYIFGPENVYKCELLTIEGGDTTFIDYFLSPGSPDENAYPSIPKGSIGGLVNDVPDGCSYWIRVVSTDPPQDSVILHPWGPFCIRHCDIETNNKTPITVCLDCEIEKLNDITINVGNAQPPPVYFICDTCPVPDGIVAFNDTINILPDYFWNAVQTSCEAPGARVPVLVKLNTFGSGNGAPTYSDDTELRISLSYMGPMPPPFQLLHSGVVGKAKISELDLQPCQGGPPGCVQDTVWMIIPKDIDQTPNVNDPLGPPNPPVGTWFMRINAYHPDINEAIDNIPGFDQLHPPGCHPVDTFGTVTTLSMLRPAFTPEMDLIQVLTDCDNKVSLLTFYITNDKPNTSYEWYGKDPVTGIDTLFTITPPGYNALLLDVPVSDSIIFRARVVSPCRGPFGKFYTFHADTLPPLDLAISGKKNICVGETVKYKTKLYGQTYYNWQLKQGRGVITDTSGNALTIMWDTPGRDTIEVSALRLQTQLCAIADSAYQKSYVIVDIYPYPDLKPLTNVAICPDGGPIEFIAAQQVDTLESKYYWFDSPSRADTLVKSDTLGGLNPPQTTTYEVVIQNLPAGCKDSTKVTITVHPDFTLDAGLDRLICFGETSQLEAKISPELPNMAYLWAADTTLSATNIWNPVASPKDSTHYFVEAKDEFGCAKKDSVGVNVFKMKYNGDTLTRCLVADTIVLPPAQYNAVWKSTIAYDTLTREVKLDKINPGGTGEKKFALFTYSVNNCSDSIWVAVSDVPKAQFTTNPPLDGSPLKMPDESTLQFTNTSQNAKPDLYLWDFGDSVTTKDINPSHTYTAEGTYTIWLYAENEFGCKDSVSAQVTVIDYSMWIPNVFTPDGNGYNDEFSPISRGVVDYLFRIYDRWGVEVFTTNNVAERWKGTNHNNGSICPPGVYYYVVTAKFKNGIPINRSGSVTLLRDK